MAVIVFGLGTGRSGTRSLASLISMQRAAVCFHEMNPSCAAWDGPPGFAYSAAREFADILNGGPRNHLTVDLSAGDRGPPAARLAELEEIAVIGDVASYYLPFVPLLAEEFPQARFPVIRRDKEKTVASFCAKVSGRRSGRRAMISQWITNGGSLNRNHWTEHNGREWARDAVWDKCYPKFQARGVEDAISQYWDLYYQMAEDLQRTHGDRLRIFDIEELNTPAGQEAILTFCGAAFVDFQEVRENSSSAT